MAAPKLGATGPLDTQTVTVAQTGSVPNRARGYNNSPALGSISDGTSNVYGGAAINKMYFDEPTGNFILEIAGSQSNSGWTTLTNTTDSKSLSRASATFSGGGPSTWTWSGQTISSFYSTNSGSKTVAFT